MASGYFPLDHRTDGKGLAEALDRVEEAVKHDYADDQYDNAAADGGALAELAIAANLIHRNLDFFFHPDCNHPSHKYDRRCRAHRYFPGGGKTEVHCDLCGHSDLRTKNL